MLDDRVRRVLARLEAEDAADIAAGMIVEERSLPIGPDSGRLMFSFAAAIPGCRALELGASRGYSTIWTAAGARLGGGHVTSLELSPAKAAAWRANLADAGLEDVATLVEGDAAESVATLEGPFDLVLLDAWKDAYEELFQLTRPLIRQGGVLVADNVGNFAKRLASYLEARRSDPTVSTLTVPLGDGLEVTTFL